MLRKAIAKNIERKTTDFRLRGHEVLRIEAFSDAVFALAVTLLIVSLEVPKSFEELMVTVRGFFAFGISFLLLMMIWYRQNIFFRRYGLHDVITIALNCTLVFLVLFYVYPLKFLFTLAFRNQIYGAGRSPYTITQNEMSLLMIIYGVGFILIYLLFSFMYLHVLRKKEELELTPSEIFDTRTSLYSNILLLFTGFTSVVVAMIVPSNFAGFAGFVYTLIPLIFSVFHARRKKRKRNILQLS